MIVAAGDARLGAAEVVHDRFRDIRLGKAQLVHGRDKRVPQIVQPPWLQRLSPALGDTLV